MQNRGMKPGSEKCPTGDPDLDDVIPITRSDLDLKMCQTEIRVSMMSFPIVIQDLDLFKLRPEIIDEISKHH
jgi:hypothetical protein